MKKILYCFIFCLCFFLSSAQPSSATGGVLCNQNRTVCTVGFYTLYGSDIYAQNGIMCNSNGTLCTNGFSVYRGSGVTKKDTTPAKKQEVVIKQNNTTEILKITSELYQSGLIAQCEFNKIKANINTIDLDNVIELRKNANLYKNNIITQFDYNRIKSELLR